jgi:hypothetical protein
MAKLMALAPGSLTPEAVANSSKNGGTSFDRKRRQPNAADVTRMDQRHALSTADLASE